MHARIDAECLPNASLLGLNLGCVARHLKLARDLLKPCRSVTWTNQDSASMQYLGRNCCPSCDCTAPLQHSQEFINLQVMCRSDTFDRGTATWQSCRHTAFIEFEDILSALMADVRQAAIIRPHLSPKRLTSSLETAFLKVQIPMPWGWGQAHDCSADA